VRALAGRIPRAFKSHRSPEGAAYGEVCRAKLQRLGALPKDAMPLLREFGRLTVELDRISRRRDEIFAFKKPRKAELRRLGSEQLKLTRFGGR